MTKRIIDADALEKLLGWIKVETYSTYCEEMMRDYAMVYSDDLIKKINKLATSATESQDSIFDADGWCWDMDIAPTDGSEIIGYDEGIDDWFIVHYDNGDFIDCNEAYNIVAWQPLPKLPTGGNK